MTAGVAGCATAVLVSAPAVADSTVTVRGVGFPDDGLAQLTMVGCSALYDRIDEPLAPFIGRGAEGAPPPLGNRTVGYDLQGGNAVGSLHYVDSMADTTTAELSVYAGDGASGVAYAGIQAPADADSDDVWIGRASVSAPAGAWTRVQATELSYTWTKYDMVAQRALTTGPAPNATMEQVLAALGGDGPGFYTIGFGCDGARFSMDAWRIGTGGNVTSYDLEGLTTTTTIVGSQREVRAGEEVTLTGRLRLGMGDRLRRGTLRLEAKPVGGGEFQLVEVLEAAATDPSVVVRPAESMVYRFRFVDRPLAEGSFSESFRVTVVATEEQPELPQTPGPTESPTEQPSDSPSEAPTEHPSESPTATPTETPSQTPPTETPPTETPSAEPSGEPEPTTPPETEAPVPDEASATP